MVTIFAVQDSILDPAHLPVSDELNKLIHEKLLYTPDMSDSDCIPTRGGGSLRITKSDDGKEIRVNGVRITTPDVIFRNGVIHYLEGVCSTFSALALLCTKWHLGSTARQAMHIL